MRPVGVTLQVLRFAASGVRFGLGFGWSFWVFHLCGILGFEGFQSWGGGLGFAASGVEFGAASTLWGVRFVGSGVSIKIWACVLSTLCLAGC